jgi:two-component system chemotaxis sensor kinase CheA
MFETAQSVELTNLNEQIDELSTRLIIDGVKTLGASDFERLSNMASELGNSAAAAAAERVAKKMAPPCKLSVPNLTRLISTGLVDLRKLLDDPAEQQGSPATESEQDSATTTGEEQPEATASAPVQPAINPLAADEDLIREFITESGEHLANIESQLLILEQDNSASDTLNSIFRGFHTIKGLAGFLEFAEIQSLAHEVETLLDLARTSQLTVTPAVVDVVLESTDIVRQELAAIADRLAGKTPPPTHVNAALLERIRQVVKGGSSAAPAAIAAVSTPPATAKSKSKSKSKAVSPVSSPAQAVSSEPVEASPNTAEENSLDDMADDASESALTSQTSAAPPTPVAPSPEEVMAAEPIRVQASATTTSAASSVRIDTGKLDQLMDMVGEMVIAQTLIGHSPVLTAVKDARFLRDLTQLARITADVQRITTGMRMVPIGLQFQKTARLVRDLARRAGKQIVFEATGEDTELDKTIAEELSDPLLHMVRNSIDHGIETREERLAAGKDLVAHVRVSAYHQSGQIVVAISDDGRGLNRAKILAKAQQNGLIQPGQQLSDNEIFLLIFEPGFSTADKITDISGRGVGMDVVRRHVQKLRGRIDIQSKEGEGTTFFIKLPLTLAIIEGLVVIVGEQRYIVPIFSVREMFRPTAEMLSTIQGKGEMVMVRGGLLPIVRLHIRFDVEPRAHDLTQGTLIVAESQGRQFCLFVDDLVGKQEVVIKSLGQRFKSVVGIAGCAILGDGRVGLILDMDGIYKGRI